MPELILLAVVSLTAMGLLVFLFLRLNQSQLTLIEFLTTTNQSLLNQVRSKDIGTLYGLQGSTGVSELEDQYTTTEDRELAAWSEAVSHQHETGEILYDDEDITNFRAAL